MAHLIPHRFGRSGGVLVPVLGAIGALASAPGCAVEREGRSDERISAHRDEFRAELLDSRRALSRNIVDRIAAKQAAGDEAVTNILILSGGGDYGAFGAGVLKAWGQVTDPAMRRPVFDVVTGVSTGALIAPLAFVGTDEAYETAFTVYQNPKETWFRERGLLSFLLGKNSYVDNAGLAHEVKLTMSDEIVRAIAGGAEEHRVLLIGTTNLDLGLLTMWDAGAEARRIVQEGASRERFDKIILASASIPAIYPAVEIDGDLYVDGAVTRNIAYTTDQDYYGSAVNIWQRENPGRGAGKLRFWVIVNNQLGTPPRHIQAGWPSLMSRSLELSIRASTLSSLKALATSLELLRLRDGYDVEFRFIAIPDDWRPPVEGSFKPETMSSLAELGFKFGVDPGSWRAMVPNPESPGN